MTWVASADESMRRRRDQSGLSAMAAPVFDLAAADDLRAAMGELAHGKLPFHFRSHPQTNRLFSLAYQPARSPTTVSG